MLKQLKSVTTMTDDDKTTTTTEVDEDFQRQVEARRVEEMEAREAERRELRMEKAVWEEQQKAKKRYMKIAVMVEVRRMVEEEGRGREGVPTLERKALEKVLREEAKAEGEEEKRERRRYREVVARLEEMSE